MPLASPIPEPYRRPGVARRIALIAESFARLLGRPLVAADGDVVGALWLAPAVIVAHGTEADPVFFFGNRRALEVFECDAARFTRMPSRLSAEAPLRDERRKLLERVSRHGFIGDYAGVRITATGRRFPIDRAIVWNIVDEAGKRHGQAATFTL
jgi:hypothetical protein